MTLLAFSTEFHAALVSSSTAETAAAEVEAVHNLVPGRPIRRWLERHRFQKRRAQKNYTNSSGWAPIEVVCDDAIVSRYASGSARVSHSHVANIHHQSRSLCCERSHDQVHEARSKVVTTWWML